MIHGVEKFVYHMKKSKTELYNKQEIIITSRWIKSENVKGKARKPFEENIDEKGQRLNKITKEKSIKGNVL